MKKLFMGATLALAATLVATPAMAAEDCVPTAAWTETVIDQAAVEPKEAVGEPTKTIPNPDYVPAVEEVSHNVEHPAETKLVEHPAETKVVHHEAEVHTEYHFAKYTQERTRTKVYGKWTEWSAWGEWSKWTPETHTSWELAKDALGAPQFHSSGNYDNKTQWERQWQAQWDGQTREVEDKAAWDETIIVKPAWTETVIVKEAWTEKVIDVEGKPAVGEPTITVPNPDYVAAVEGKDAVTHTVDHAAVTCPATAAVVDSSDDYDMLAQTGGDVAPMLYGVGAAAVLGIGGALLLLRRRHGHVEK